MTNIACLIIKSDKKATLSNNTLLNNAFKHRNISQHALLL